MRNSRSGREPQPGGGAWLLMAAVLLIGGAVVGGYWLARQRDNANYSENEELNTLEGAEHRTQGSVVEPEASNDLSSEAIALAAQTGCDILVTPRGARVTLDGQAIGPAPLRVRSLRPGKHQITVEGPVGFHGRQTDFELSAGQATVIRIVLEPLGRSVEPLGDSRSNARSSDESSADPAHIESIGGSPVSKAGLSRQEKAQSSTVRREVRHAVRARGPRGQAASDSSPAEELVGAVEVSLGTLMLGSKPPCAISIDGKETGLLTPQRAIQLPVGIHHVVLSNATLNIRKSFKVRIEAALTTRAIVDLTSGL